jgi:hypothetical protein
MVHFFGGVMSSLMGCFPLSAIALGFSPVEQWRRCEVMEVYASGFAGYPVGYFIECIGSDDWLACVIGIPSDRVLFPNTKGFSLNSACGSRIEDFLRILCQGAGVFACLAKRKFPNSFKSSEVCIHKQKGIIATQIQKLKFHYLLPKIQTSLVQTNQKVCLAQTGDG